MTNRFRTRVHLVLAEQYDGGVETGDRLISWVQRENPRCQLSYKPGVSGELFFQTPEGTDELLEGYWLVMTKSMTSAVPNFSIVDDKTFRYLYEEV